MQLSLPFAGETADSLLANNMACGSGFYLLGMNRFWHGGIHLTGTEPVLTIADGTIVAYRIAERLREYKEGATLRSYSNSFVLIEHEYHSPKGNTLKFYSLYMHLLPTTEYKKSVPAKPYPVFFKNKKAKVAVKSAAPAIAGVNVRNFNGDKVGILPNGATVKVGPPLTTDEKRALKQAWMREPDVDFRAVLFATDFKTEDNTLHPDYLVTTSAKFMQPLAVAQTYKVAGNDKPEYPAMDYLKGLAIRSSASAKDDKNVVAVLRKGTEIVYSEIDREWAKLVSPTIPGVAEPWLFAFRGTVSDEQIVEITTFDQIVGCKIPVKAGDVVGYPGSYALPDCPATPLVHLEVFADDNLVRFIENKGGEGVADQKIVMAIECGKELKKREDLNQGPANAAATVERWTRCKVTDPGPNARHSKVEIVGAIGVVEKAWLGPYAPATNSYPPKDGAPAGSATTYKEMITAAFGGADVKWSARLKLIDDKVDSTGAHVAAQTAYRKVSVEFAASTTVFVSKSDLPTVDRNGFCLLDAPIATTFKKSPDQYKFTDTVHKFEWTEFRDLKERRDAEVALDAADAPWIKIDATNDAGTVVSGWIKAADVREESVFDWPRFQVIKETGGPDDAFYDVANLSPFFKSVVKAIDKNKDQTFSDDELLAAQKDPAVVKQVSQLICLHPSEWQVDASFTKWNIIKPWANWDENKKLISELAWWDPVKASVSGFPGPDVYHVHPLAFVDQMTKYVAGTRLTQADKLRIVKVVAELESGTAPYTATNRDLEFEGYWDLPTDWYLNPAKARPDAKYNAVPHSKYFDTPRHIGLSFGLIQFTQQGPLGRLVSRMHAADPALFEATFGEHFQDLINTLTATGADTVSNEEVFDRANVSMGVKAVHRAPSVQPVAGHEVWESYWVDKFVASGREPAFQECQRALAVEDYLDVFLGELAGLEVTEKTLALIYDRSVQAGAGNRLAKRVKEEDLKTIAAEKAFWNTYISGQPDDAQQRMNHIRNSSAVSWDRRYAL